MLETQRLIIRFFQKTDGPDLYEYLSLPETYRFEPGEPISKVAAKTMAAKRAHGTNFLAVVLKKNEKMIGHLYFQQIPPDRLFTWELGYIFNPVYQRQGFARESARRIVQYGFEVLNAHRIIANCNPENTASWKLLEHIGMRREGHFLKKAYFRTDDSGNPIWFDSFQYAILNPAKPWKQKPNSSKQ